VIFTFNHPPPSRHGHSTGLTVAPGPLVRSKWHRTTLTAVDSVIQKSNRGLGGPCACMRGCPRTHARHRLFTRVLRFGGRPVELVGTHVTEQLPYINRARRRAMGESRHQSRVRRGETVSGRREKAERGFSLRPLKDGFGGQDVNLAGSPRLRRAELVPSLSR
jgi:hypothetical protein